MFSGGGTSSAEIPRRIARLVSEIANQAGTDDFHAFCEWDN
ncbi:hypothetical protein [Saliphagus sp. LR7]|nr:hypothetical protein [Saliphagus sp. LR7]